MHIVIFGLSISSSWGNGHATLWRSLIKSLLRRGHTVVFYEKDVPYYAARRDLLELPAGGRLRLYADLATICAEAQRELDDADLALCTSFCPDGAVASDLILMSRARLKAFYDLDTPVTLNALDAGERVEYLPPGGLADFDLVLSFTGGPALDELQSRLRARVALPLYGSVDPQTYRSVPVQEDFRASLAYLGTYAEDRQPALERLFLAAARSLPWQRFLLGGALYPQSIRWPANVSTIPHVSPPQHPAFFSSCRATLNLTRAAMARYGFCPSGRLFEAAACGAPLLSDEWHGIDRFFTPGRELLPVRTTQEVCEALSLSDAELRAIGNAGRVRVLAEHTGDHRVAELERICNTVCSNAAQVEYA